MSRARVIIAGAGLGGLVAALVLLDRGFAVEVHEQAPAFGEVGAMDCEASVEAGFDRLERARRPRTALVHAKSIEQGKQVQDRDPDRYDGAAAPSSDPAIFAFDPVSAPFGESTS